MGLFAGMGEALPPHPQASGIQIDVTQLLRGAFGVWGKKGFDLLKYKLQCNCKGLGVKT